MLYFNTASPRTGTTSTAYTFNVTVTNLNLVVNKNGSYFSTIPLTNDDTNSFNYTYQGTTNGSQSCNAGVFMSTVYTTFTPIPDTLNTTNTYEFYVTATLTYSSVVTSPLTSGYSTFWLWPNTIYTTNFSNDTGCTLTVLNSPGTHNTHPENLYCDTASPYSYGTSYTNILNCNNIKMLTSGDITKETVISSGNSTYQSYLTVRDCGVYLYNSAGGYLIMYPIYYQIPDYSNFTGQVDTTDNLSGYNVSNSGGAGVGQYGGLSLSTNDDAYIIYPNYGIKVYTSTNFVGLVVDFYNSTNKLNIIRAVTNNRGKSCKIYYKGVEITSY
jgi:hypothetical protein